MLYANGALAGSLVTQTVQRDASGGKVRTDGFALSYDLGVVKPYFAWSQDKERGTVGKGKARSWDLSAEIRLNPANTVAISYADRDESDGAASRRMPTAGRPTTCMRCPSAPRCTPATRSSTTTMAPTTPSAT